MCSRAFSLARISVDKISFAGFQLRRGLECLQSVFLRTTSIDSLLTFSFLLAPGGTALAGGSGTIMGSVLGALIMQCIDSGMLLLDVSIGTRYIIIGQVLIAAVVFDVAYRKWTGDAL